MLERVGHYRIAKLLGQGAMGSVYAADDEQLERRVALKVLKRTPEGGEIDLERFRREGQALASVAHPNVTTIHEAGIADGVAFIALELVAGTDLKRWIAQRGKLPWATATRLAAEIASGLEAIHRAGLVHRDLKPANVLVDQRGHVKLTDFGIARSVAKGRELTETGTAIGTLEYMSPEQASAAENLDARSDLYSLGIVLFEMLTGDRPFSGTGLGLLHKHMTATPMSPRALIPEIPEPLDRLVLRLLAKKPEQRPGTASDVMRELRDIGTDSDEPAPSDKRTSLRALVALVIVAGAALLWVTSRSPTASPRPAAIAAVGSWQGRRALDRVAAGRKLFEKGELLKALDEADRMIVIGANVAEARALRALVFRRQGHISDAAREIKDSRELLQDKLNSLYGDGRLDEALELAELIVELNPAEARATAVRAMLLNQLGRFDEALLCIDRAILLEPKHFDWWRHRAMIREGAADYTGALEDLDRAINCGPGEPRTNWVDCAKRREVIEAKRDRR